MNSNDLFANLSSQKADEIFRFLFDTDRNGYRGAVNLLAARRNLRPAYLEKKTKAERHQWMAEALAKKKNEDLALEILQNWILNAHTAMVVDFLEQLGIAHDGKGLIDETPPEPSPEKLDAAIASLLGKYDRETVIVYLHLFAAMDPAAWPHLSSLVASSPAIQLGQPVVELV